MIFDIPTCGGCRTCEIACSFKHTGTFVPSISSLKVIEKESGIGYKLLLIEESNKDNVACDGCYELAEPLCVQFCSEKDELARLIKEHSQKKLKNEKKQ